MTKVTVYVDDSLWISFKQYVYQKHGSLKLSSEVEKLIRDAVVEDAVISGFKKIGINTIGTITSQQIKLTRPKSRGSQSAKIIEQMRQRTSC